MAENIPDEPEAEEQAADELEEELLDAMRNLGRKNKSIEEYLDGLARAVEKPPEQGNEERQDQD